MYIAVILENYTQARDDVSNGITDEDYDMFYEVWAEFDPDSTMYMPYASVGELIDCLEPPLQIAKPNKFKVVHMDIPIVRFSNPKTGEILLVYVAWLSLIFTVPRGGEGRHGLLFRPPGCPHAGVLLQGRKCHRGAAPC